MRYLEVHPEPDNMVAPSWQAADYPPGDAAYEFPDASLIIVSNGTVWTCGNNAHMLTGDPQKFRREPGPAIDVHRLLDQVIEISSKRTP